MSLDLYLYADVDLGGPEPKRLDVWRSNITHNLGTMASAADLYEVLWRPEENGIATAGQMIEPLERGLNSLRTDPQKYKAHNPSNGWGSYDGFVKFVEQALEACKTYPKANVYACR